MNIRKRFTLIVAAGLALSSLSGKDIKGRVTDTDGVPMEFVNVVLLHDSAFVDGVITDGNGCFCLSYDAAQGLRLRLSYVGFNSRYVDITPDGELGDIRMTASANTMLENVVIKGNASRTYLKGNALVTNVENSILAKAGTAKDVLRQIPMVGENQRQSGNIWQGDACRLYQRT